LSPLFALAGDQRKRRSDKGMKIITDFYVLSFDKQGFAPS
jgi:hypothetical protein